jgi:hypothetical protein
LGGFIFHFKGFVPWQLYKVFQASNLLGCLAEQKTNMKQDDKREANIDVANVTCVGIQSWQALMSLVSAGWSSLSLRTSAPCFSRATILPFGFEFERNVAQIANHDLADLNAWLHPVRNIFNAASGLVTVGSLVML